MFMGLFIDTIAVAFGVDLAMTVTDVDGIFPVLVHDARVEPLERKQAGYTDG
jgi:hypothetical protein